MGMGGGGGGGAPAPQAQNQIQVQRPPAYVDARMPQFLDDAYALSQVPYTPYEGDLVAPLNQNHNQALDQGNEWMQYAPQAMYQLSQFASGAASSNNPYARPNFGGQGPKEGGAAGPAMAAAPAGQGAGSALPEINLPQVAIPPPPGGGAPDAAKTVAAPEQGPSMWARDHPSGQYAAGIPNTDSNVANPISQQRWDQFLGVDYDTPLGQYVQPGTYGGNSAGYMSQFNRNDPPGQYEMEELYRLQEQGMGNGGGDQ